MDQTPGRLQELTADVRERSGQSAGGHAALGGGPHEIDIPAPRACKLLHGALARGVEFHIEGGIALSGGILGLGEKTRGEPIARNGIGAGEARRGLHQADPLGRNEPER